MPATEVHPTDAELQAFTLGTLDDPARESVETHLTDCLSCQARAAGAPADALLELLRSAHAWPIVSADTPAPASVAATMEWAPTNLSAPAELAGHARYRLLRQVGAGGMGTVWLAEHNAMGRKVALKVIRPEHLARPGAAERFRREVHAAACLHHPNIVTAYDADQAGATHFLVMEYVEGVSLTEHLERTGPLPVAEACRLARDAALGLQHAHEHGLIHRDIKPHNIMLTADGGVKVLDFGLAALAAESDDASRLTGVNMVVGTPDYIAPEQAEDAHAADIRSDVYSLGCTLYQMLAGRVPFPGDSTLRKLDAHRTRPPEPIRTLRSDVPPALALVLAKMMTKDPAGRYQTPAEVAAALEPFVRGGAGRPRRRWPFVVAAALLFTGLAAAGVGVYRVQTDNGELVITTESDDVEVVVKQGGKLVRIIDTKTEKEITLALRSGTYELELKGAPEGLKLNIDKATLTRGETVLAKIERMAKAAADEGTAKWSVAELPEKPGLLHTLQQLTTPGGAGRFSPDGRLYALSEDHNPTDIRYTRIYETATGRLVRRLEVAGEFPSDWVFMPDGKHLLIASAPLGNKRLWTLHLFDIEKGDCRTLTHIEPFEYWPGDLQVSRDGKRVWLMWEPPGYVQGRVLDLDTGRVLLRVKDTPREEGLVWESFRLSEDGKWLMNVLASHDNKKGRLRIIDVEGKRPTTSIDVEGLVIEPFFPPDAGKISAARQHPGREWWIESWDLSTGQSMGRDPDGKGLQTLDYWPRIQGQRVVGLTADKRLVVFEMPGGKEVYRSEPIPSFRNWLFVLSRDGRMVAVVAETAVLLYRLPDPPPEKVREVFRQRWDGGKANCGVDLSPDGRCLISMHWDGCRVWDVSSGRVVHELQGWLARFTPDGKQIVTGLGAPDETGNCLRLYDTESGKLLRKFGNGLKKVDGIIVYPDNRTVLANEIPDRHALYDLTTGDQLPNSVSGREFWGIEAMDGFVKQRRVVETEFCPEAVLPGGREVVARCPPDGRAFRIYEIGSGRLVREVPLEGVDQVGEHFTSPHYGRDRCPRLAVSRTDGTIHVLDLIAGKDIDRLSTGGFQPKCLAVSADGRYVAASANGQNSDVVVWRLPDPPLLQTQP